ncbi:MAG: hypothetical protein OJF50_002480 [Nitrospira sp.]|nr:hypothetical protein [Nitrospira sp.]
MTTLSKIKRQAYLKKIRTWHEQRGMDIEHQILTEPVMRYIERLEAALEPFKSGEWGAWKAWLVEGAPTRAEGIQAAKILTKYQCVVDDLLAQHGGRRRDELV